jgi:hypothetical protein
VAVLATFDTTMPPRRRKRNKGQTSSLPTSEDSTAEETPQKRKKHDNNPLPGDIVDDMERLMGIINSSLPEEYAMFPTISEIPRDLLKPRIFTQTVLDQLEVFKRFARQWRTQSPLNLASYLRQTQHQERITTKVGSYFDLWYCLILNIFQDFVGATFLWANPHSRSSFRRRTVRALCRP